LEWLQSSVRSQETALEVAVPDKATVARKQGQSSLTGQLTAFNRASLRLSAAGYSETVPLYQIKSIEFEGDVWIEGQRLRSRIRGTSKTLQELPTNAFRLGNSPKKATISLKTMSPEGLERLLKDTRNKSYGVKKILLDSSEKMTIQIGEIE
jgi:hypothetical protein